MQKLQIFIFNQFFIQQKILYIKNSLNLYQKIRQYNIASFKFNLFTQFSFLFRFHLLTVFHFQISQQQDSLENVTLSSSWQVHFQVKQRQAGEYNTTEFEQSFVSLGKQSNKLKEVLDNYYTIPPISQRKRGMIAIFRDNIRPLYEDQKNNDLTIVKFSILTSKEKQKELLKNQKESNFNAHKIPPCFDEKGNEKYQQIDQFIDFLVISMLLGKLEFTIPDDKKYSLNGAYFKLDEQQLRVELWFNNQINANLYTEKIGELLNSLNSKLDYGYENEKNEHKWSDYLSKTCTKDYQNKKRGPREYSSQSITSSSTTRGRSFNPDRYKQN